MKFIFASVFNLITWSQGDSAIEQHPQQYNLITLNYHCVFCEF